MRRFGTSLKRRTSGAFLNGIRIPLFIPEEDFELVAGENNK
jgi:hypothetical protein